MKISQSRLVRAGAAVVLLALLALPFARSASASTQSSMTFQPVADTYVSASYPGTNYGGSTSLRADASPDVRSYLRFSVSGLGGLPIASAKLRIYAKSSSSAGLTAKVVSSNSWGEKTMTYNTRPAMGTSLGTSAAASTGTWASMDVSAFIKSEGTFSLGVITSSATAISLASRESGTYAPQLILTLGTTSTSPTPTPAPTSGSIKHVFVIVMENRSYSQVWNTSSSPYITSLGNSYVRATNYYAVTHPSLPNYLDLVAGSNYSITNDCSPSSSCHISAATVADKLEAKGLTWKAYMESMPAPCYLTTSGKYAPKHNPFVYFDNIRTNSTRCNSHDVPYTAFATDLASASTTPNFVFISPNLCNDMHDCSVSTGDSWLKAQIPPILKSPACTADKCLLVLTWDEDDSGSGNHILTIFAGPAARTGGATSSVKYTHFSLLRTIEYIFGLPTLTGNDAGASPMTDMLQ